MKRVWLGALVLATASIVPLSNASAQTFRGEEGRRDSSRFTERDDRFERGRRSEDTGRFSGREMAADTSGSPSGWGSSWWSGDDQRRGEEESGMSLRDRIRSGTQQFMQRYDQNRDGYLARNEVPAAMRQNFDRADLNHDGYLSGSELRQRAQLAASERAPVLFTALAIIDAERGRVDVDDLQQAYDILQRIDENGDGEITRDELQHGAQRVAQRIVDRVFQKLDQNEDEQITLNEASDSPLAQRFQEFDENRDNRLTRNELRDAIEQPQVATRIRERLERGRGERERR
jgi:Ca2+-binding EF-hand superfamily protein